VGIENSSKRCGDLRLPAIDRPVLPDPRSVLPNIPECGDGRLAQNS
jgi:hypothetical protein